MTYYNEASNSNAYTPHRSLMRSQHHQNNPKDTCTMTTSADFTPSGIKLEGPYENDRNGENADLYKAIIREAYGVTDVICGHHLVYQVEDKRADGFVYTFVEEIPSADTLIFDHEVARKIWGEPKYITVLQHLACVPPEARDKVLRVLYEGRSK